MSSAEIRALMAAVTAATRDIRKAVARVRREIVRAEASLKQVGQG